MHFNLGVSSTLAILNKTANASIKLSLLIFLHRFWVGIPQSSWLPISEILQVSSSR